MVLAAALQTLPDKGFAKAASGNLALGLPRRPIPIGRSLPGGPLCDRPSTGVGGREPQPIIDCRIAIATACVRVSASSFCMARLM